MKHENQKIEVHESTNFEVSSSQSDLGAETSDVRLQTSHFDVQALLALPIALRRFALWKAMTLAARGKPVSFEHVEAAMDLVAAPSDRAVDMPGHTLERLGGRLVLRGRAPVARRRGPARTNFFEYPLSIPGEVPLPEAGCVLA